MGEQDYELQSIKYTLDPATGVAIAAHNDEKTLHALTLNLTTEAFMVLEHAARDPEVKVLIWTATGERSFCSGAALKGAGPLHVPEAAATEYAKRRMMNDLSDPSDSFWVPLIMAFWDFPKPVVGAINGLGVGGGANIALANVMDLVICSTNARFMYPFSTLGITPEMGSSLMMPYLVGMAKAKEMMMLGATPKPSALTCPLTLIVTHTLLGFFCRPSPPPSQLASCDQTLTHPCLASSAAASFPSHRRWCGQANGLAVRTRCRSGWPTSSWRRRS